MTRWPAKHRARPEVASGTGVACLDSDGKTPRRYVGGAYRGDMGGLSGHPAPYHSAPGLLLPECYQPMKGQPHDSAIQPSCDDNPRPMGQADRNDPRLHPSSHRFSTLARPSVGQYYSTLRESIREHGAATIAIKRYTQWQCGLGTVGTRLANLLKNWGSSLSCEGRPRSHGLGRDSADQVINGLHSEAGGILTQARNSRRLQGC